MYVPYYLTIKRVLFILVQSKEDILHLSLHIHISDGDIVGTVHCIQSMGYWCSGTKSHFLVWKFQVHMNLATIICSMVSTCASFN